MLSAASLKTKISELTSATTLEETANTLKNMSNHEILQVAKALLDEALLEKTKLVAAGDCINKIITNTKNSPAPDGNTGDILYCSILLATNLVKQTKPLVSTNNTDRQKFLYKQTKNLGMLLERYMEWLSLVLEDVQYEQLSTLDDRANQHRLLTIAEAAAQQIGHITHDLGCDENHLLLPQISSKFSQYLSSFNTLSSYPAAHTQLRAQLATQAEAQSRLLEHAESIYYSTPKNPLPNTPSDLTEQAEKIFRSIIDTISMVNFAQYLELSATAANECNQQIDSPETANLRDIKIRFNAMASNIITIPGSRTLHLLMINKRYPEAEKLIADSLENARSHLQLFLALDTQPKALITKLNEKISTLKTASNQAKILLSPYAKTAKERIAEQIKLATQHRDLVKELDIQPDQVTAHLNNKILHLKCLAAQITANSITELKDAERHYQDKDDEECKKSLNKLDKNITNYIEEASECKEEACEPKKEEIKLSLSLTEQMFASAKLRSKELKAALAIDSEIATNSPSSVTSSTEGESQADPNMLQLQLQLRTITQHLKYHRVDLRPEAYQPSGKRQQEKVQGTTFNNPLLTARLLEAAQPQLMAIEELCTKKTSQILTQAKQAFDNQQFSRCEALCNSAINAISKVTRDIQYPVRPFPVVNIYHNAAEPFERLSKAAIIEMRKIEALQNPAEERPRATAISFKPGLFSSPTKTTQPAQLGQNKRSRTEASLDKENIGNSPERPFRKARFDEQNSSPLQTGGHQQAIRVR